MDSESIPDDVWAFLTAFLIFTAAILIHIFEVEVKLERLIGYQFTGKSKDIEVVSSRIEKGRREYVLELMSSLIPIIQQHGQKVYHVFLEKCWPVIRGFFKR
ncbi:uncharacterized protein LOC119672795 [Teleopsis dalmanni]|uniref:uncharacterized protein LOC119672794 n=1 Tax=Teleopsis dalmanni TaxID=139649 RepID=UPI0018CDA124|nr:uncharacterized protein LOC119672794 [Teleopsis dalmanni]XP_037939862.1 uncharacterized protein LOC119672795 [Teleopsis dalmanni]